MASQNTMNRDIKEAAQETVRDIKDDLGAMKDHAARAARTAAEAGTSGINAVREHLHDGLDAARHYASDAAHKAREYASEAAHKAREYAGDAAHVAKDRGGQAIDSLERTIRANPMAALAVAAGVGVVLGLWLRRRD